MNKEKDRTIKITGSSETAWKSDLHLIDAGYDVPKQCYLCKRQNGEKSVCYSALKTKPIFYFPTIQLEYVAITIGKGKRKMVFWYPLCLECKILLGLL